MSSSEEDEGETLPNTITNYHLVNESDEPVPFSDLPLHLINSDNNNNNNNTKPVSNNKIFLHGTTDSGLQKIYKQVIKWRFDVSDVKPEVYVMLKEKGKWVQVLKARKSFENVIRSVLVTVSLLHFVRRRSEAVGKAVWDHLSKEFSSYETRPSENDLIEHMALISEAVKGDETLAKSKFLVSFLEEKPCRKKSLDEDIPSASFIVDDDMIDDFEEEDGSEDEEELYDTVCSICDNGGDILCCDGRCMRSFHATEEAGSDSYCESLGWSDAQVEATQSFICKNCQLKQHQCFACGELGSSDKLSGPEVFPCVSATCGRFYHLPCVAKLLHRDNVDMAEEFQKKVSAGGTFTCPIHKCIVCKQGEDKTDPNLQFAVCRRCPKSYHRKCLPRKIAFDEDENEGLLQRAWEGLIPNRILIYCLKHEIDDDLKTPPRNHIKFPGDDRKKKKQVSEQFIREEKLILKKKSLTSEDEIRKRKLVKVQKGVHLPSSGENVNMSKNIFRRTDGQGPSKKLETKDTSKDRPSSPNLGSRLFEYMSNKSFKGLPEKEQSEKVIEKPAETDMISSVVRLDNDSKRRIMALVKDVTASVTMEHIIQKQKIPKTHVSNSKYTVDKTITLGKVEHSVEAIRAALQKLQEGGSIEDARAVCEPGLLHQIVKWKNKMRVYLSPFLYGMRYTSFGRHFTKVDKLKEIVNVLHRYVQDDDMIVDFCCGANDFSWFMKRKLDETGKKCLYKNYDILQAKNDFNFEKRDWTTVQPNELPEGSRLIMGLNPPFGVQASLANKFIDKALEFKPKLLILIVPKETERLDQKKKMPYDLIWEDNDLLAGKSFYLPGSVDVNDNQLEDWNVSAPPLYLWSRPDWTSKHMTIAQQHGHLSSLRESSHQQEKEDQHKSPVIDLPLDDRVLDDLVPSPVHDNPVAKEEQVLIMETRPNISENLQTAPCDDDDKEIDMDCSDDKEVVIREESNKTKPGKQELVRESVKPSDKIKEREQHVKQLEKTPGKNKKRGGKKQRLSPYNLADDQPSRLPMSRSEREVSRDSDQNPGQNMARPGSLPRIGYGETHLDEIEMRLSEREGSRERDYHYGQNMARPESLSRTGYGATQSNENEMRRRLSSDNLYGGSTNRWPCPDPDFGVVNIREEYVGYQRDSLNTHGFRPPHFTGQEQYSRGGLYDSQDPLILGQRSSFLGSSQDPVYLSGYNLMGSNLDPRMNSSTMQRYAPRLDEMNHLRTNNPGYSDQFGVGRSVNPGYNDQFGLARPGNPGFEQYGIPRTSNQPDYRVNSSGFARSFAPNNSSGWLNDNE